MPKYLRLPIATLALVLLVGGLLRLHAIDRFGTGFDELFSVLEANGLHPGLAVAQEPFVLADLREHDNFRGAANACIATDGGNGIMYILALHSWTAAFGNSNIVIRLFSFCCGIMVIVLVFRLAHELSGDDVQACLAAGLAALAPILVDYSQESRSYMLATAITLQATRQFTKLVRSEHGSRKQGSLYGLISGLALLCHYHAAYILAGHALYALFRIRFKRHALWSLPAASVAIAVLGCWLVAGGWLGIMNMAHHHARYAAVIFANPEYDMFYRAATPKHLLQDAALQLLWLGGSSLTALGPSLRVMAALLLIPFCVMIGSRWSRVNDEHGTALLFILSLAGPAYCLLTSAIATHTFGMRYYYAILSAPYVAILLSRGALGWLGHQRPGLRSLGWVLLTMQAALMAASIASFYAFGYHGNRSPEVIAPFARTVNHLRQSAPDARVLIIHGSARDAMILNLHLSDADASVPQVVETLSPYRHAVVASTGGTPRIIMRLD